MPKYRKIDPVRKPEEIEEKSEPGDKND